MYKQLGMCLDQMQVPLNHAHFPWSFFSWPCFEFLNSCNITCWLLGLIASISYKVHSLYGNDDNFCGYCNICINHSFEMHINYNMYPCSGHHLSSKNRSLDPTISVNISYSFNFFEGIALVLKFNDWTWQSFLLFP